MFVIPQLAKVTMGVPCVRIVPPGVPTPGITTAPGPTSILPDYTVLTMWQPTDTMMTISPTGIPAPPMPGAVSGTPVGKTTNLMASFRGFFGFKPAKRALTDTGLSNMINSPNRSLSGSNVLLLS